MAKKRKFAHDDLAVWRRVQSTVTPLETQKPRMRDDEILPFSTQASPNVQAPLASPQPRKAPLPSTSLNLKPTLPTQDIGGLQRSTRRALQKGTLEPDGRIDLHGLRLEDAHMRFKGFLRQSAAQGARLVLVITGKGGYHRMSDFGTEVSGVIRRAFPTWMQESEVMRYVSHFTPAHIKHGGDGAWYVFIRANARRSAK